MEVNVKELFFRSLSDYECYAHEEWGAAENELLEKQAYTSDLERAKDVESKLADVYKHRFGTIGGTSYLADCAAALKGNHPLPSDTHHKKYTEPHEQAHHIV